LIYNQGSQPMDKDSVVTGLQLTKGPWSPWSVHIFHTMLGGGGSWAFLERTLWLVYQVSLWGYHKHSNKHNFWSQKWWKHHWAVWLRQNLPGDQQLTDLRSCLILDSKRNSGEVYRSLMFIMFIDPMITGLILKSNTVLTHLWEENECHALLPYLFLSYCVHSWGHSTIKTRKYCYVCTACVTRNWLNLRTGSDTVHYSHKLQLNYTTR
jgi:hypothetical protein